jgi:hypothetical protein
MFASKDDGMRHRTPSATKNEHAVDVSLTVFVSVPGAVMLFALVVMAVGSVDWKANVRIKDDGVRHCSLSMKKEQACSQCFTHGICFSSRC